MNRDLPSIIQGFRGLRVVVVGDAMLDSYLEGTSNRICREAPVPIVNLADRKDVPGGAANTAVNLHALGAQVAFLSIVGDDAEGQRLRWALEDYGLSTEHVLPCPFRSTLAKNRVVAGGHMLVRLDQGTTAPVDAKTEQELINRLIDLIADAEAVVVSDYSYGVLTPLLIDALARLQRRRRRVLVVDSRHRLTAYKKLNVTAVKPNYEEAIQLLGLWEELKGSGPRTEKILPHGNRVLELTGARVAAVTLDTEGAMIFERGCPPYRTYAQPTPQSRAAGAGDTFIGALTLALAAGASTPDAAETASAAAAVVVAKDGTAICSAPELLERISAQGKFVPDVGQLVALLDSYRQRGKRIVFTNGCFDILHRGHITYLNQAKALGDILVVGVNTDEGVRRLKGPERPINTLEDRVHVLAALSSIDHLIAFGEDTPCELVRHVRPHVFVKGGDYTRERLPEATLVEELGGMVKILPFLDDRSTTRIIKRIQHNDGSATDARPKRQRRPNGKGGMGSSRKRPLR
jgi:D-beta-D-heptose 7-phosphate kinase/D-beta-D-heptose 1-phosphate adenosyltransferase